VWHAGTKAAIVQSSLEASGLLVRTQIIWAKNNFAISRGHYHAPTLPLSRAAARPRARLPEIKGRGRPTRSSAGRSIG
jgi:hypothetical protein